MSCWNRNERIDDSLLFFFLLLVVLFCSPGIFGCGDRECCEPTCC